MNKNILISWEGAVVETGAPVVEPTGDEGTVDVPLKMDMIVSSVSALLYRRKSSTLPMKLFCKKKS
jgi:hypothetical protein